MADKEVTLKLSLKSDGFKAGLKDAEGAAKKAGDNIGKGLTSAMANAGKAGLDALKGSLSTLKSAIGGIAGIAGGFGVVEFARRAISAEAQFKKLSFQIRAGTGEMRNWRDMQRDAQATALKFGQTSEDVGKSISDLYAAVGDPKFALAASKVVAEFATGAHEPLEVMTNLAGGLNEKFGITAEQLPDVLAQVVSLGNKGGVSVEDLADKIGIIGANAKGAGLDGQKGFGLLVGMLNIADNATGTLKKGITGVTGIIEGITNNTLGESLQKNLHFDLKKAKKDGLEFDDILGQIIEKSGGSHDNLAKVFAGDQLKVVTELAKVYQEGFDSKDGSKKEKTKAAWDAYEEAIKDASKSQMSANGIREEAAREMMTPEKKIATALERMAQMFTTEKMSRAFEQLATALPKIVDAIMNNPEIAMLLGSGVPGAMLNSLPAPVKYAALAGLGGGFLGWREGDRENREQQALRDNSINIGLASQNSLGASRTMRGGSRAEYGMLADEAAKTLEDLTARQQLASAMWDQQNGKVANGQAYGTAASNAAAKGKHAWTDNTLVSPDRLSFAMAQKNLGAGASKEALAEETMRLMKQAMADATGDGMSRLNQGVGEFSQAQRNFAYRAAYGETAPGGMADLSGMSAGRDYIGTVRPAGERAGLGLGGDYKSSRELHQEALARDKEAKDTQQKSDNAGLIAGITDPITQALSRNLRVDIVSSVPLDTKGTTPTPGSVPVP